MKLPTFHLAPLGRVVLLAIGSLLAHAATAQNNANAAGAQIANSGAANGVAACASCHGAKGEGNAAANFPRLSGQPAQYLAHQLAGYADGSRNNAVMTPIAKGLSQEQREAVAAYYAGLAAPAATPAKAPAAQAQQRGELLATVGDDKLGVQGCVNCHGPGGTGEPPTYPYLAGQHAGYLSAALGEWKSGARNTDASMQMSMIAKRLSDTDIAALAAYYASLPAPAPTNARGNIAAGTPQRPAASGSTNGPAGGTSAAGGGIEQGAPTEGGSQGIGGGGAASGSGPSGSK